MRFEALKVGDLAQRTGLTVRTLHHYDAIGLLRPSLHTEAGYRLYTAADIARLQQVLSLRQLGFSLDEVRDCLDRPGFSPLEVIGLHVARLREQIKGQRKLCSRLETDGKPDLAVTNALSEDISVFLNNSPNPVTTAPVPTTTKLTASAQTPVLGQQVTLTATVTITSGKPTGTAIFLDGSTLLGEVALDPNGQARLIVRLGVGLHSLHASFAGLAPFTDSTSATLSESVNKAATMTTLTVDTAAFGIPGFVLLTATVAPVAPGGGVPTGTITFMEGSTVLGTAQLDANGQATLLLENPTPGTDTATASYSGDSDFLASISAPVPFTIP
jgi:DNA-binding transcriptional MerR regulator